MMTGWQSQCTDSAVPQRLEGVLTFTAHDQISVVLRGRDVSFS